MKNIISIITILFFAVTAFAQPYQIGLAVNPNQSKTGQYIGIATGGKELFSNTKRSPSRYEIKGHYASISLTEFADALKTYLELATLDDVSDSLSGIVSGDTLPYYEYAATLTQTSTNAPVATVMYNTFSGSIVWTRNGAGDYRGTLTGAFPANKVIRITTTASDGGTSNTLLLWTARGSDNYVSIGAVDLDAGSFTDGSLANAPIIIRVDK